MLHLSERSEEMHLMIVLFIKFRKRSHPALIWPRVLAALVAHVQGRRHRNLEETTSLHTNKPEKRDILHTYDLFIAYFTYS